MAKMRIEFEDVHNADKIRTIAFWLLKTHGALRFPLRWGHPLEDLFEFAPYGGDLRMLFMNALNDIIWEFLTHNILVPGFGQNELPYTHISELGKKILESESLRPDVPGEYLEGLQTRGKTCVTNVVVGYLRESILCYLNHCYVASVLLLGVASETLFLRLLEIIARNLPDEDKKSLGKRRTLRDKHRWVVDRYRMKHSEDAALRKIDGLDISLQAMFDFIRRARNDLGHPQENMPNVDRNRAYSYLVLFADMIPDIELFSKYCLKTNL